MRARKHGRDYRCGECGELHTTAFRASQCCYPVQDAPEDDNPDILRTSD